MTSHPSIFSLMLYYKGAIIETKGIKVSYLRTGVIYKIALPTKISSSRQCWFSSDETGWKLILGHEIDRELINSVRDAIFNMEQSTQLKLINKANLKLLSA